MKESSKVIPPFDGIEGPNHNLINGIWPRSVPLWMSAFYIALFIIRPWDKLLPWMSEIHFERLYGILLIVVVLLSSKKQFQMSFQSLAVLLFIGALGISGLFAWKTSLAWDPLYKYATVALFYFILVMVIRTPYELAFIVTSYIATMAVYLAKSQWEFFRHGARMYRMEVVRLAGIESVFGGPNWLACSIVLSLPILVFLWSIRKELSCGWPDFWRKWFPRFLIIYFALAVSSIILTNSRSGMLSFILFVLLLALRGKGVGQKLGYILLGVLFLLTLWQVMPAEKKNRFRTIWNPKAGPESATISAQGRIEGLKAGLEMFDRFPITGVGIGNFIAYRVSNVDEVPLQPHSLTGQLLGETGFLGTAAFFLLVITALTNCRKVTTMARDHTDSTIRAMSHLTFACQNIIILLAFEGLFNHNLLRFNWLWICAFSVLAVHYVRGSINLRDEKKL